MSFHQILQTSHPYAVEPFLLLAKTTRGAATAKLIQDALEASQVYVFTELMENENVKTLETSKPEVWHLLKIFCHGVYQDYVKNKQHLPELNELQLQKLKHLTLVTMASRNSILNFDDICTSLDVGKDQVEQLIIDAMYNNLLSGKLDTEKSQFIVDLVMGRDVVVKSLSDMDLETDLSATTTGEIFEALQRWDANVKDTMKDIDAALKQITASQAQKQSHKQKLEQDIQAAQKQFQREALDEKRKPKPTATRAPTAEEVMMEQALELSRMDQARMISPTKSTPRRRDSK